MKIGEVIRKYRKNQNMTQEEMANRLGVTTPAVNKWENGNSYPDIMLLAPIARLLNITVDTLLCFRGELTAEEIKNIIYELDNKFKKEKYEEVFQLAKDRIKQYPNSEQLIWQIALILDVQRLVKKIPNPEKYEDYIISCYIRVLNSKDENIRSSAAGSLFHLYMRKEQYEKAEEYLGFFSKQNPERKRKQAVIYSKTNRIQEAYKTYEELLFSSYQMVNMVLNGIYILAMQDNNLAKAHSLIEKQKKLAVIFEMGEYRKASYSLELATMEKDVEATIDIMEKMLSGIDEINSFCKSPLYEHMSFQEVRAEFIAQLKGDLLDCFRDQESYSFLNDNKKYKELVGFEIK